MKRRTFIVGIGATTMWSYPARSQQRTMPVIGYLDAGTPDGRAHLATAFKEGLGESGYFEGRNVAIEYRWANTRLDLLPELAADLVLKRVAVIAVVAGGTSARAAKAATATIPIVFGTAGDPVAEGLVASLNRPGGNATGFTNIATMLTAKRLGLLNELLPTAARFAVLSGVANIETVTSEARTAATVIGKQVEILGARTDGDIEDAFAKLAQQRTDALVINAANLFSSRFMRLIELAAHQRLPTLFYDRSYPAAGGLMSYGASIADQAHSVGLYTGRVLKGEKPADLPVMQPTKFDFVINARTARALGLAVPPSLRALAHEVIE